MSKEIFRRKGLGRDLLSAQQSGGAERLPEPGMQTEPQAAGETAHRLRFF